MAAWSWHIIRVRSAAFRQWTGWRSSSQRYQRLSLSSGGSGSGCGDCVPVAKAANSIVKSPPIDLFVSGPELFVRHVVNAADYSGGGVAPGEIVVSIQRQAAGELDQVTDFYRIQLFRHRDAVSYPHNRGLRSPEVIEHMRIGYAPGRCLRGWLTQLGYPTSVLRQAGLLNAIGNDTFTNRVAFPLGGRLYGRSIRNGEQRLLFRLRFRRSAVQAYYRLFGEPAFWSMVIPASSPVDCFGDSAGVVFGVEEFIH
jgi:hypothetical protein